MYGVPQVSVVDAPDRIGQVAVALDVRPKARLLLAARTGDAAGGAQVVDGRGVAPVAHRLVVAILPEDESLDAQRKVGVHRIDAAPPADVLRAAVGGVDHRAQLVDRYVVPGAVDVLHPEVPDRSDGIRRALHRNRRLEQIMQSGRVSGVVALTENRKR